MTRQPSPPRAVVRQATRRVAKGAMHAMKGMYSGGIQYWPTPARSVVTLRKKAEAIFLFATGQHMLIGLGDGGDDTSEMQSIFENLSIVLALLLGIIFAPYEHSAESAATIDSNVPGLGTVYNAVNFMTLGSACVGTRRLQPLCSTAPAA